MRRSAALASGPRGSALPRAGPRPRCRRPKVIAQRARTAGERTGAGPGRRRRPAFLGARRSGSQSRGFYGRSFFEPELGGMGQVERELLRMRVDEGVSEVETWVGRFDQPVVESGAGVAFACPGQIQAEAAVLERDGSVEQHAVVADPNLADLERIHDDAYALELVRAGMVRATDPTRTLFAKG